MKSVEAGKIATLIHCGQTKKINRQILKAERVPLDKFVTSKGLGDNNPICVRLKESLTQPAAIQLVLTDRLL